MRGALGRSNLGDPTVVRSPSMRVFSAACLGLVLACAPSALAGDARSTPPVLLNLTPAWLGIEMAAASDGVRVEHVVRGSPADKAGVREGDHVVKVDGASVSAPEDVSRIVSSHRAADAIDLVLRQDGHERTARAMLIARPTSDEVARMEFVGAFAPGFTSLQAVSGALPVLGANLKGRVVVLEFWATWCGPCRMTTPTLGAWQGKYGAQGLSVVGVTTDPVERASLFVQEENMKYASVASDPMGVTHQAYRIRSIPTLFVIDKRGVVRDVSVGFSTANEAAIEREIGQLLAEPDSLPAPSK